MQVVTRLMVFAVCSWSVRAQPPDLRDDFRPSDCHLAFDERLRLEVRAPLIILGEVLQVSAVGQPKPSTGDPRVKVQLTRIQISTEEVIKGNIRSGTVDFYYFTYEPGASEIDLGVRTYRPHVGQRRIYFLKPSNGLYRSVGDVTDYTLRVNSGRHGKHFCTDKRPGCCIADILLVPGDVVDVSWFVADMDKAAYIAQTLCSDTRAHALLGDLVRNVNGGISRAAIDILMANRQ